jgi:hypothetical protein
VAIRGILSALKTAIEAATPTTGSTAFRVVEDYPAADHSTVPAPLRDRSVLIFTSGIRYRVDFSGRAVTRSADVVVRIAHDWRKRRALETETVRVEDVIKLLDVIQFGVPGASDGAGHWQPADTQPVTLVDETTTVTTLQFELFFQQAATN